MHAPKGGRRGLTHCSVTGGVVHNCVDWHPLVLVELNPLSELLELRVMLLWQWVHRPKFNVIVVVYKKVRNKVLRPIEIDNTAKQLGRT